MASITIEAKPAPIAVDTGRCALVIIDMQRDFLEPGGFGEALGNDVSQLRKIVAPLRALLGAARDAGITVIHTREGHRPDMTDAPPAKVERGAPSMRIGDRGPMGRILIRGEVGLDKPGKGAFYQTDLDLMLRNRGVDTLLVCGVTTEVCVHTTVREANDRGYRCIVVGDCCGSYFPEFHEVGLRMIAAQGGIFGWVADSGAVIGALRAQAGFPGPTPAQ